MLSVEPFVTKTTLESSDQGNFIRLLIAVVNVNQTLRKSGRRVWEIGWGGSVPCTQKCRCVSDWFVIACLRAFIGNASCNPLV